MEDYFIKFKENYNKEFFATVYENSCTEEVGSYRQIVEDSNIIFHEEINSLFDRCGIDLNAKNCSLARVTRQVLPHTNPGNNGLVIFPIDGMLEMSFYSYNPPIVNGMTMLSPYPKDRVHLSSIEATKLLKSKFETFTIDNPIAVNGRRIFSYRPVKGTQPLIFLLKIPFNMSWDSVKIIIENAYV